MVAERINFASVEFDVEIVGTERSTNYAVRSRESNSAWEFRNLLQDIPDFWLDKKIQAIKKYREIFGSELADAKHAIERPSETYLFMWNNDRAPRFEGYRMI